MHLPFSVHKDSTTFTIVPYYYFNIDFKSEILSRLDRCLLNGFFLIDFERNTTFMRQLTKDHQKNTHTQNERKSRKIHSAIKQNRFYARDVYAADLMNKIIIKPANLYGDYIRPRYTANNLKWLFVCTCNRTFGI